MSFVIGYVSGVASVVVALVVLVLISKAKQRYDYSKHN